MKNRNKYSNFFPIFFFGVEKSKFANRLKRALPKFRGDRSQVRGVNGRSKFVAASAGRAERKQCAGVPPPAWLNPAFLEVWAEGPTEWGSHGPSRAIELRRTFSSWAPSWLQVRIFSQFVCIFFARCFEVAFFIVSWWFLNGFWKVWGRFWGCFGGGFSHDFQKIRFLKK